MIPRPVRLTYDQLLQRCLNGYMTVFLKPRPCKCKGRESTLVPAFFFFFFPTEYSDVHTPYFA